MQLTAHRLEHSISIFLSILDFFQKDNVRSQWTPGERGELLDSLWVSEFTELIGEQSVPGAS